METEVGNKLIAKFLGWVNLKEDRPERFKNDYWQTGTYAAHKTFFPCTLSKLDPAYAVCEYLFFHSDWNWLMGVVEKIKSMRHDVRLASFLHNDAVKNVCEITNQSGETLAYRSDDKTQIEVTWLAVVDFINWYNKQ